MEKKTPSTLPRPGESVKAPSRKYSWVEIKQAVHDLRRELSPLSTMVPSNITFRKLADEKTRIYFLRTPHNGWEITLLYSDVNFSKQSTDVRLEWHPLLECGWLASGARGSREEQLLWERQRVAAWGIASFELHPGGTLLFPAASALFVAGPDETAGCSSTVPRALATCVAGAPLTPALCPRAPHLVAHAARGDLWLAGTLAPARLTYACRGAHRLEDDPRQAGVPSYVMQEEFSRYSGFWWQPKSNDDVYRIAYEEVDESEVEIFSFPSSQAGSGETEEFRFPRAGTRNARSILRLVQFETRQVQAEEGFRQGMDVQHLDMFGNPESTAVEVCSLRWFELNCSLEQAFPWCEYVPRIGWTPCGQFVWVQLLDRKQQRLELVLIQLEEFCERFHYELAAGSLAAPLPDHQMDAYLQNFTKQVLITESAPTAWINVHDILHFLPREAGSDTISFIWASEETGHLHLYLVTSKLAAGGRDRQTSGVVCPDIVSKIALTSGEWEVVGKKIWVDEPNQLIYFVGLRETPLERHLYVTSYVATQPRDVRLLTDPGFSYSIDMDQDCSMVVVTYSNVCTPPACRVLAVRLEGAACTAAVRLVSQGTLMERATALTYGAEQMASNGPRSGAETPPATETGGGAAAESPAQDADEHIQRIDSARFRGWPPPPRIYDTRLEGGAGERAYCLLWRPAGCRPGVRYPTVLHVYGGPQVQTVTNTYKGMRQLRMHMLAARGFCVVAVDSRGSKHRGRAWESAIRARMGQVELDDQVEVLQWLARETGCIDLDRVAVHGWSYGGYLSLLGLATRPGVFRACVAGAPVTSWQLYDTAYTERYMGEPRHAPHAYARASVLTHAPFFPDQDNRLLIIHGLVDENVHFSHTAALVAELVRLGKPHRLQLYPAERHSLRRPEAAKHYEATLIAFLHEVLS